MARQSGIHSRSYCCADCVVTAKQLCRRLSSLAYRLSLRNVRKVTSKRKRMLGLHGKNICRLVPQARSSKEQYDEYGRPFDTGADDDNRRPWRRAERGDGLCMTYILSLISISERYAAHRMTTHYNQPLRLTLPQREIVRSCIID